MVSRLSAIWWVFRNVGRWGIWGRRLVKSGTYVCIASVHPPPSSWCEKPLKPWTKIKFSSFFRCAARCNTDTLYWVLWWCCDKISWPRKLAEAWTYLAYSSRHIWKSPSRLVMGAGRYCRKLRLWLPKARTEGKEGEELGSVRLTPGEEISPASLQHQLGTRCPNTMEGQSHSSHTTYSHTASVHLMKPSS